MGFRSLPTNMEAFFSSLMVGFAESYFVAAALETGVSPISAGLLIPISMVLGAFMSLSCSGLMPLKHTKRIVLVAGIGQALSLLGLLALVYFQIRSELGFLIASVIYYFFGFVVIPFWNLWLSELVPKGRTTTFFNLRLQYSHLGLLTGLIGGGFFLNSLWGGVTRIEAFSILFFLAIVSRLLSVKSLSFLRSAEGQAQLSVTDAVRLFFTQLEYRNFFSFMFLFYLTIAISSPFVSPFLLTDLKFSYTQFMGVVAAFLIGKYSFFPFGSRLLERVGVRTLIRIGAFGISPLPFLWYWCNSFPAAFALQFASGIFWAFFEMGFSVIFFKHLEQSEKVAILSLYNFFNAFAVALGGLLGAWLIQYGGGGINYYRAFCGGAILRLILVFLVPIKFEPERAIASRCVA